MLTVWGMVGVWGLTVPSPCLRDHLLHQELPFPCGGACQGPAVPAGVEGVGHSLRPGQPKGSQCRSLGPCRVPLCSESSQHPQLPLSRTPAPSQLL